MELADLMSSLGNPGKFQILLAMCLWCCPPLIGMNHTVMAIYGAVPDHSCKLPSGITKAEAIPTEKRDGKLKFSQCKIYKGYNKTSAGGEKESCPAGWVFDKKPEEENIVTEWDLVCGDKYLISLSRSLYFVGVMLGGPIFGLLSDRFGRKKCLCSCLYMHILMGIILSQVPTFVGFVICRVLLGFFLQGTQTAVFIILVETVPAAYRTKFGTVHTTVWGFGTLWVAFLAYFIRDWRSVQLALCIPSSITILYIWVIPESPRWLMVNNKKKEMAALVEKIAKRNNLVLPKEPQALVDDIVLKKEKEGIHIFQMMKNKLLRARILIVSYIWMTVSIGYYGLALNATRLRGDKYLNFLIHNCVELPSGVLCIVVLHFFGRRKPLAIFFVLSGIGCVISGLIPKESSLDEVAIFFALCGKLFVSSAFITVMLMSAELFPTSVRNGALGSCFFATRVGGIIAPQLIALGDYTFKELPIFIIAATLLGAAVASIMLTETKHQKLFDTIMQHETTDAADMIFDEKAVGVYCNKGATEKEIVNEETKDPVAQNTLSKEMEAEANKI